jgi:hypothetical protein
VNFDTAGINKYCRYSQEEPEKALKRNEAPDNSNNDPNRLPTPVYHIQEFLLKTNRNYFKN